MKKIILFAIGLLTSVVTLAGEHTHQGVIYQYDPTNHTAFVKDGTGCSATELVILDHFTVEGDNEQYTVNRIREEAFAKRDDNNNFIKNDYIEYLFIPNTIQEIGANAFNKCSNIRRIVFEGQVSSIGSNAFKDCTNMDYVCCKSTNGNSSAIPLAMQGNNMKYLFSLRDKVL